MTVGTRSELPRELAAPEQRRAVGAVGEVVAFLEIFALQDETGVLEPFAAGERVELRLAFHLHVEASVVAVFPVVRARFRHRREQRAELALDRRGFADGAAGGEVRIDQVVQWNFNLNLNSAVG